MAMTSMTPRNKANFTKAGRTAGALFAGTLLLALSLPQAAAQSAPSSSPSSSASQAPEVQTGDPFYCGERKLGTWFYCDKPKRESREEQAAAPAAAPPVSATEELAAVTRELDELKARAILYPTEENLIAYVSFQRQQLDRASVFADQWQRSIWQNPELDYTLQRPVSTLGKRAWSDNRREEINQTMRSLSQRYGIFYFYAQSCGACDIFAPILKSLANESGFKVVAVSMDGGPNTVFPDYVVDAGQHSRMGLTSKATPALVLYDTQTKRPIPIGAGIMAADEIKQRIFVLTRTEVGSDY